MACQAAAPFVDLLWRPASHSVTPKYAHQEPHATSHSIRLAVRRAAAVQILHTVYTLDQHHIYLLHGVQGCRV